MYEHYVVTLTPYGSNGKLHVYTYRGPSAEQLMCAASIVHCLKAAAIPFKAVNVESDTESDRFYVSIQ